MAVARVTLSKAVLSFEGGAATIVVELLEKKDERKLPKWGRDHDQNSVSICTATLMIYRLSFFSHHYFTLRGSSGAALLSRSSHEINDGGEERVCQTDLTLAWMIYWSAIRKWDFL